MSRTLIRHATLTLVCLAVGFLLVAQFRTHATLTSDVRNLSPEELSSLISRLIEDNTETQREITTLLEQNATYERKKVDGSSTFERLETDLSQLRAQTGAVPVQGAGVEIKLDYALRAADLLALVNELRNAGAEAIAINNQRIVARTTIDETAEQGVMIDGAPQAAPYYVTALGDSNTLMGALNRLGGLLRIWSDIYHVGVQIDPRDQLMVPGSPPRRAWQYAQPAP